MPCSCLKSLTVCVNVLGFCCRCVFSHSLQFPFFFLHSTQLRPKIVFSNKPVCTQCQHKRISSLHTIYAYIFHVVLCINLLLLILSSWWKSHNILCGLVSFQHVGAVFQQFAVFRSGNLRFFFFTCLFLFDMHDTKHNKISVVSWRNVKVLSCCTSKNAHIHISLASIPWGGLRHSYTCINSQEHKRNKIKIKWWTSYKIQKQNTNEQEAEEKTEEKKKHTHTHRSDMEYENEMREISYWLP